MSVKKKHIGKLLVVVQQCVSSIQICLYKDLIHLKDNIFGLNRSIELLKKLYLTEKYRKAQYCVERTQIC